MSIFKDDNYIAHRRDWDKKNQYLSDHLNNVSDIVNRVINIFGLEDAGRLIGFLHDIGKASEEFENYIKSATGLIDPDQDSYVDSAELKGKIDHATAGGQLIWRQIDQNNRESRAVAQILSLCIMSHHSGLIDCISPEGKDKFSDRVNKAEARSHINEVLNKIDVKTMDKITSLLKSDKFIKEVLSCFRNLKTENDSLDTFLFKNSLLLRLIFSCLIDADRLDSADFENPKAAKLRNNNNYIQWQVLIDKLDAKLAGFKNDGIGKIRQIISKRCHEAAVKEKGLYLLTVPTGGGKTFSSLRFALNHANKHKMDRIIYVLPYTTIIDQNAHEIRKVMEGPDSRGKRLNDVVLEHHSNILPERQTARQKILSENWDAQIVLTTSVQFLESFFGSGTRGARRMHQLANAVIIFDEVQAIPVKCVHMFNLAVSFLVNNCHSTVILCTATQPLLDKIEPASKALVINESHKIVPDAKELFGQYKRYEVHDERKIGGWSNNEIKQLMNRRMKKFKSALMIVNTKKSAREIYKLCSIKCNYKLYHLSTFMCPAHRMEKLNKIKELLENKQKVGCISTQLIEAGVDISFGSVIRFLSGLDSIAQSAGRCNRHNEFPSPGNVTIINPSDENIDSIKHIKLGKEISERIMDEFVKDPGFFDNNILSEKAMEQYYRYYFYQRQDEMSYPVNETSLAGRSDTLFNLFSLNKTSVEEYKHINGKEPDILFKQSFMTASKIFQVIDGNTRGIIVPYEKGKTIINKLCGIKDINWQYKLVHEAQWYTVNVFDSDVKALVKEQAIHETQDGSGILYLDDKYYSDDFGLNLLPVKEDMFLMSE